MVLANLLWKICIGKLLKLKKLYNCGIPTDVHVGRQSTCSRWEYSKYSDREIQKICSFFADIFFISLVISFYYGSEFNPNENFTYFYIYVCLAIFSFISCYFFLDKYFYFRQKNESYDRKKTKSQKQSYFPKLEVFNK